ncbi:hypothetical protein L0244_15580, partial [bacterium]|nr:hypothetical protein [bacterium]
MAATRTIELVPVANINGDGGGTWNTIDMPNGFFSTTFGGILPDVITLRFASTNVSRIVSAKLTFNAALTVVTASSTLSWAVSYDDGVTYADLGSPLIASSPLSLSFSKDLDVTQLDISKLRIKLVASSSVGGQEGNVSILKITLQVVSGLAFPLVKDVAQELAEELGEPESAARVVRLIERWIDDVYRTIMAYRDWQFARNRSLLTVFPNISTYTLDV